MTKRERIRAVVEGREPDKLPYSFWTHLPGIDLDPERLAEETYKFYRTYDVDFIKTMNNGMYAIEDFGCEIDYSEVLKGGVAHVVKTPIHQAEDWYKLSVCPVDKGSLARELKSLALLLEKTKQEDVPVIFTVFSPITTANKLSGGTLRQYLADGHGEAVHHALKIITETTCQVAKRAIELGADGIFFAAQSSTYDFMTAEEYEVMKNHVAASVEIIRHLPMMDYVIPAVIGHHERYDGKGYPRRIAGNDIPLAARILCIVDSFDAMVSKRCYKHRIPLEEALRELERGAGTQFDPELAAMFCRMVREGRITLADEENPGI